MEPNLTVYFNTVNNGVALVIRVVSTGEKRVLSNGEATQFTLPAGSQTLILKIGKKNYSRNVLIIPGQNVNVFCAFDGRGRINVENPYGNGTPQFAQAGFNGVPSTGVPTTPGFAQPMQPGAPMPANFVMDNASAPVAGFAMKSAGEAKAKPFSPMAIVGFILSFFVITSPLAVILGILDLILLRKKFRGHGLAVAGIVIGTGLSIILFILISEGALG